MLIRAHLRGPLNVASLHCTLLFVLGAIILLSNWNGFLKQQ